MNDSEELKEQLAAFAGRYGPTAIVPAEVKSVNGDDTLSVLFADGSTVDDVRLKALVKEGNQFLIKPTSGSKVLIGRIANSEDYVLIAADAIDSVEVKIGTTLWKVNEKIVMKAGAEDLLTLMKDLIQAMIDERHMTNTGPTISLTPDSVTAYNAIKTRFETLLNND